MSYLSSLFIVQGTLSLDSHVKLLKKIKAAAQTMDYKALVHGDSPLDVVESVVRENNVHLLAKISSKIPMVCLFTQHLVLH